MASFTPNTRIQVLISEDTELGKYQDALYFSPSEYEALKDEEVAQMSASRAQKWVNSVKLASSQERPEPSKEELQAQADELAAQLSEVQGKLDEVKVDEVAKVK